MFSGTFHTCMHAHITWLAHLFDFAISCSITNSFIIFIIVVVFKESVEHPSEAHIARKVPSVLPVGPPLHPSALTRLPESVLYDRQMIGTLVCLSVVEWECNTVWHRSECNSCVDLFLRDFFFKVPHVNLVGSWVNWWNTSSGVWCNGGFLVCVLAILELDNLADEYSLGVGGVGT